MGWSRYVPGCELHKRSEQGNTSVELGKGEGWYLRHCKPSYPNFVSSARCSSSRDKRRVEYVRTRGHKRKVKVSAEWLWEGKTGC